MVKETIEQFARLQYFDTKIFEDEKILAEIPEMLREKRSEYETLLGEKNSLELLYNEAMTDMTKTAAENADYKTKLVSAQKKLNQVQNKKEYEAALKEMDNLTKNISDTDSAIKILNERAEDLKGAMAEKAETCLRSEEAYLREKDEKEEENKELFEELNYLKKEREIFASAMKKSLLSTYERVRSARNNLAIAPINNETCTGCYMKIPPQLAVEVKKEKEIFQCPYCQRFLYSPRIEAKAS